MRKILIILLLLCSSLLVAKSVFQKEIADTLISRLKDHIDNKESYYLINSNNSQLDSYLLSELSVFVFDLRTNQSLATKTISCSIAENLSYISKRSFLTSRQVAQSEYLAQAKIIDNASSRIEHNLNFAETKETPVQDGDIVLWKSLLISLMAGTLIYSLWSIE